MPRARTHPSALRVVDRNRRLLVRLGRELRDTFRDLDVGLCCSDELAELYADSFQRVAWLRSTPGFRTKCLLDGWHQRADEQADAYRQARGLLGIEAPEDTQLVLDFDAP